MSPDDPELRYRPFAMATSTFSDLQVFFDGEFRSYADVQLGLLTGALNYGTGCFEGIRAYWNEEREELRLLAPAPHYRRLQESSRILGLGLRYGVDELVDITLELLRRNGFRQDVYLRPLLFVSQEAIACQIAGLRTSFGLCAIPFGDYVPVDRGLRCVVSTWRRTPDLVVPARAKVCGAYVGSALAKSEALTGGFDEAITLTMDGKVSEGSGENIFVVRNGVFATPPVTADILEGVTRDLILTLVRDDLGMQAVERPIDRSELYTSDEILLCGTGAQIAGVVEVDRRPVGDGRVGPCTSKLQERYLAAVRGQLPAYERWSVGV